MKLHTPNTIATAITNTIIIHNPDFKKKKDEIRYGLEWMISGMIQVILTLMAAIFLGVVAEAAIILISGASLRMFSGGAHANSYFKCLLLSLFQIMGISLVVKYFTLLNQYTYVLLIMLIICVVIHSIKAPVLHKKKDMFNAREKRKLKYLSISIFGMLFVSGYLPYLIDFKYCIWLSLIMQSITLTSFWEKILSYGENFKYKSFTKEDF
ncbi:hypothetical protein FGG79_19835 [Bacillus sp. BHET2]|uniref:accessory gene regulator ArgB-like protein n=1 Tax=Bacillus sp. BHET2 TaxID=2583818 RepID=UPI00110F44D9|nr:accessory gene regulator B family protein [Bacillus sp. BHET2]TMU83461.1 hypothetical protein FGG79_19835 [Bacillus sp. BHET2]